MGGGGGRGGGVTLYVLLPVNSRRNQVCSFSTSSFVKFWPSSVLYSLLLLFSFLVICSFESFFTLLMVNMVPVIKYLWISCNSVLLLPTGKSERYILV